MAVAFAARKLGVPAAIFVPSVASPVKMAKIRGYGAELIVVGDRYAEALDASRTRAEESGALEIHAYDSVETLRGQGTVGLELDQQVPDLDTVLVAIGGGGLIGGVAAYFANRVAARTIKIVGVEPETAPTLTFALRAGRPVDSPAGGIAADSLAPKRVGELMFPIAQRYVDEVVLVSDQAICEAQSVLWDQLRVAAEPAGRRPPRVAWRVGDLAPVRSTRPTRFGAGRGVSIMLCRTEDTTAVQLRRYSQYVKRKNHADRIPRPATVLASGSSRPKRSMPVEAGRQRVSARTAPIQRVHPHSSACDSGRYNP